MNLFRFNRGTRMEELRAFDLESFKKQLAALPEDSPLFEQLLALCDAYVLTEAGACASPSLDDAEAHRLRGRMGMMLDLKAELIRVRADGRKQLQR